MKAFLGWSACLAPLTIAFPVMAADLTTAPPPILAATPYNWTGLYTGDEVGGGWFRDQTTVVDGSASFPSGTVLNPATGGGVLAGSYAGFNYQFNQIVVGIDGDYIRAGISAPTETTGPTGFLSTTTVDIRWAASVTGRLGYAVNNLLLFVKGGAAWAEFGSTGVTYNPVGGAVADTSSRDTHQGWTIGAGLDWGFAPNWAMKFEYDYAKFATANFDITDTALPAGTVTFPARSSTSNLQTVKLGVEYRFNWTGTTAPSH